MCNVSLIAHPAVWIPHASLDFPTSRLRSFSWSTDGTLFSVTFESRVVLYDSSSVAAVNTISCSAILDSLNSHFIGNRYLLITSKSKLLLWDLILQSGTCCECSSYSLSLSHSLEQRLGATRRRPPSHMLSLTLVPTLSPSSMTRQIKRSIRPLSKFSVPGRRDRS